MLDEIAYLQKRSSNLQERCADHSASVTDNSRRLRRLRFLSLVSLGLSMFALAFALVNAFY